MTSIIIYLFMYLLKLYSAHPLRVAEKKEMKHLKSKCNIYAFWELSQPKRLIERGRTSANGENTTTVAPV